MKLATNAKNRSGERRRFRRWWGIGCGLALAVVTIAATGGLTSIGSVTVVASGIGALPYATRAFLLVMGCGLAIGTGACMALPGGQSFRRIRLGTFVIWAGVATLTAGGNLYLANHPGPRWLYETTSAGGVSGTSMRETTSHRSPTLVHLLITLPIAGALGALLNARLINAAARRHQPAARTVLSVLRWAAAAGIGGLVVRYADYFVGAGTIDLFEASGLNADAGKLAGRFLAGFMSGYLVAAIGGPPADLPER